jgi:1,4-alpha-glucan branching enzyme
MKAKMNMKPHLFRDNNLTKVNRMTQFTFPAPTARQVSLAGEFNNWDTKAGLMHKGPDGVWHLGLALKPGRYEYRFVADEVWCDDPAAQLKTMNSLGTENCVCIV